MSEDFPESFEELYQTLPCGYATVGLDGTILRANSTLLRWLGRTEYRPGAFAALLTDESRRRFENDLVPRLRVHGTIKEAMLDLVGADGSTLPVLLSGVLARDAAGRATRMRLTFFHARDRRDFEQAVTAARHRAEQMAEQVERFSDLLAALAAAVTVDDVATVVAKKATTTFGASDCQVYFCGEGAEGCAPDGVTIVPADGVMATRVRIPFVVRDRAVGAAELTFEAGAPADPDVLDLLRTLARHVGDTIERARLHDQLRQTLDLYADILAGATEQAIIVFDADGRIKIFNTGAERMLGYSAATMIGAPMLALHEPDEIAARSREFDAPAGIGALTTLAATAAADIRQWTWTGQDGTKHRVELTVTPMAPQGLATDFVAIATEVTARAQEHAELALSEERNRLAFDNAPIGMALLDLSESDARLVRVNRALAEILSVPIDELIEGQLLDTLGVDARADLGRPGTGLYREERHVHRPDGSSAWLLVSSTTIHDEGATLLAVVQVEDVTRRRQAEERLTHLAFHDPLTGLANRPRVLDHLEIALARAGRGHGSVGVLFLDLDNFKDINDSLGHAAGDEVLAQIAARLQGCLRSSDTAGRLGGDEFAVVCEDLGDAAGAAAVAQEIATRVEAALATDFVVGHRSLRVTASTGIAVSTPSSTPEELLRDADAAMYRAKQHGRARWRLATPELRMRAMRQTDLESDLRRAIERGGPGELALAYQPSFDLSTDRVVGVEALLRWAHPTRGWLTPGHFLDVAEDRELILPLGAWVLTAACRQAAEWEQRFGDDSPEMWVNISARQLAQRDFPDEVAAAIERSGASARRVCLEITERQLLVNDANLVAGLRALSEVGVRLALDDFGSGNAGLDYLRRVPIDILKLDRSYLLEPDGRSVDAKLARGIVGLGHALGLTVAAEGVETALQHRYARDVGCHLAQGFLLARPHGARSVEPLLQHSV